MAMLLDVSVIFRAVFEAGTRMQKRQLDQSGGAVTLLGDDDFGEAFEVGIIFLVDLFAEDEGDDVGVLLDGARLAQIGELRSMVSTTAFGSAAELRERDDRDLQFLGDRLEAARDGRDLLRAVLE